MTRPVDIVAAAVHAAQCGCPTVEQPARDVAAVAVNALADDRIVHNGVRALRNAGYGETEDGPHSYQIADADIESVVAIVLRSVGEE